MGTDIAPSASALNPQPCSVLFVFLEDTAPPPPHLSLSLHWSLLSHCSVLALLVSPKLHQDEIGYHTVCWGAVILEQIKGPVLRIPGAWRLWPETQVSLLSRQEQPMRGSFSLCSPITQHLGGSHGGSSSLDAASGFPRS